MKTAWIAAQAQELVRLGNRKLAHFGATVSEAMISGRAGGAPIYAVAGFARGGVQ